MPSADEQEYDELDGLGATVLTSNADAILDEDRALQLVVVSEGTFLTRVVAPGSELTIGRSNTCDLAVDHHTISRRHAVVRVGSTVTIEDLGSANGTRVRGARLEPNKATEVVIGELIGIGAASLLLQTSSMTPAPRRALPHDQFEQHVAEACMRHSRSKAELAVVRIYVDRQTPTSVAEDTVVGVLREADIVGKLSPHVFEVLLDCDSTRADDVVVRIHDKLLEANVRARLLTACCPRDGTTAGELFARIDIARARRATPAIPVVADAQMQNLHRLLEQVAASQLGVLLLGETGVGKDVFARTLHRLSPRAAGPFIELNCAALTESLLESELFGHEKGAFTSATSAKTGLIEAADGGTLLLDEIGDMPLATQVKLLRVIEDSQVRRVGGLKSRTVDVRFVAATNCNLEEKVAQGTFRSDLLFRLNGMAIVIPPLRDRVADIEPLARAFLRQAVGDGLLPQLTNESLEWLRAYRWPGNVRELKHMMERAALLSRGKPIEVEHLAVGQMLSTRAPTADPVPPASSLAQRYTGLPRKGSDEEREWILDALERAGGNQTLAAQYLGISRRTLVSRLTDYDVERPRKPKPRQS